MFRTIIFFSAFFAFTVSAFAGTGKENSKIISEDEMATAVLISLNKTLVACPHLEFPRLEGLRHILASGKYPVEAQNFAIAYEEVCKANVVRKK